MATDTTLTAVQQDLDAFNDADADRMADTFDAEGSILDAMSPHLWHGPTAAHDWYRDVLIEGEQHGASGYFVAVDDPVHNDVGEDSAYVVVPATRTFDLNGTQTTQTGLFLTAALRRLNTGWRIAAWTKGTQ